MTRRLPRLLCVALALAACDPVPVDDGATEIAGELRAIRALLAERQPGAQPGHQGAAAPPDAAALKTALGPLEQAVQALVRDQGALQERQLALTEELGRWSALLAASAQGESKQQLADLQQRLAALEAQLRAQDARHKETEALVQKALETTAARLEAFLDQVEQLRPGRTEKAHEPGGGAAPSADKGSPVPPPKPAAEGGRRTSFLHAPSRAPGPWFFAILVGSLGVIGALVWRLAHPAQRLRRDETTADESWLAATMFDERAGPAAAGETVAPAPTEPMEPPAHALPAGAVPVSAPAPAPEAAPPAPAAAAPRPAPEPITLRLPARDPQAAAAAVLSLLAADPRVLRRPAPRCTARPDGLEVAFVLLPGLLPGERAQLRSALERAAAPA